MDAPVSHCLHWRTTMGAPVSHCLHWRTTMDAPVSHCLHWPTTMDAPVSHCLLPAATSTSLGAAQSSRAHSFCTHSQGLASPQCRHSAERAALVADHPPAACGRSFRGFVTFFTVPQENDVPAAVNRPRSTSRSAAFRVKPSTKVLTERPPFGPPVSATPPWLAAVIPVADGGRGEARARAWHTRVSTRAWADVAGPGTLVCRSEA